MSQESHKPRTWKTLKKRRRKERGETTEEEAEPRENKRRRVGGMVTNIIPLPEDPDAYVEDDSVKFHQPMEVRRRRIFFRLKFFGKTLCC
jgi:hypothetical protein